MYLNELDNISRLNGIDGFFSKIFKNPLKVLSNPSKALSDPIGTIKRAAPVPVGNPTQIFSRGNVIKNIAASSPLTQAFNEIKGTLPKELQRLTPAAPETVMANTVTNTFRSGSFIDNQLTDLQNPVQMSVRTGAVPMSEKTAASIDRFGNKYIAPIAAAVLSPITLGGSQLLYTSLKVYNSYKAAEFTRRQANLINAQSEAEIAKAQAELDEFVKQITELDARIEAEKLKNTPESNNALAKEIDTLTAKTATIDVKWIIGGFALLILLRGNKHAS
jgi:hypothetical protein